MFSSFTLQGLLFQPKYTLMCEGVGLETAPAEKLMDHVTWPYTVLPYAHMALLNIETLCVCVCVFQCK